MSDDPFGSASEGTVSSPQDTAELEDDVAEEETTQLNVEIPAELHRRLKTRSVQTGTPMKDLVEDLLDRNLET
jgi:hypothetical protein